jgi:ATP-dependent DNA helicase DinG
MDGKPLIDAVEDAFRTGLPAVLGESFEVREEQVAMSIAVAQAIEAGSIGVIEAETGLGKSLAYLVPLVLHCARTGARAAVSTYTKNLQGQLVGKDFELATRAASAVKRYGRGVTGAVLMGRANYACLRRMESMGQGGSKRSSSGARGYADPVVSGWLEAVRGGDTGELDAVPNASLVLDHALRQKIACPPREAACAGCGHRDDCYLFRARRRALEANVVITNHALLFSNLLASGALLGPIDVLVVDEAHHLDDVATEFFSISYSPGSIRGAHHSVYAPEHEEVVRYVRAMVLGESTERAASIDRLWASFHEALDSAEKGTGALFSVLRANSRSADRRAGGAGRNSGDADLYQEGSPLFYGTETARVEVSTALGRMAETAGGILAIAEASEGLAESGAAASVRAIRDVAVETRVEFDFLTAGSADDHVFYVRMEDAGVSALAASPVDVSGRLGTALEEESRSALLTSATLAVDGDFTFAFDRLGLTGSPRAHSRRFDSPFDLDDRRLVLLAEHMPDPGAESFLGEAADTIRLAAAACDRRVMVLCTARGQVAALQRLLSSPGGGATGVEVFAQTEGANRADLLDRFRRSRRGILLGLASFWEGVDLPGEDLELLVILKLPFLVPTEPVTQARSRRLIEAGDNPFEKLFIPDVVLKLRQGMGRLIRTSRDRGAVILLDRRLWHSRYGEFVLRAVTNGFARCRERENTIEHVEAYFEQP